MHITWDEEAWNDYVWWQFEDRKTLKRINALIKDIQRNGNEGIGKPEPLRYEFSGYWSRRIDSRHRLIYQISDDGKALDHFLPLPLRPVNIHEARASSPHNK